MITFAPESAPDSLPQHGLDGGEHNADAEVIDDAFQGAGAYIMGRKMFGGGDGPWDETWTGWWGENPPFHAPVFVLTHHHRQPLTMKGGTTFTFVTDGIQSALKQARTQAGEKHVAIAGGASAVQQYLAAGLLDELYLHVVPIILGAGERLLEDVGDPTLEPVKVVASPAASHIKYRVIHEPESGRSTATPRWWLVGCLSRSRNAGRTSACPIVGHLPVRRPIRRWRPGAPESASTPRCSCS